MSNELGACDFTLSGPELDAYGQLMQLDDHLPVLTTRPDGETAGTAYDEVLDAN